MPIWEKIHEKGEEKKKTLWDKWNKRKRKEIIKVNTCKHITATETF
jgi:hypothetical protein